MTGSIELHVKLLTEVMNQWMELLVYDVHESAVHLQEINKNLERIANVMELMEVKE